MSNINIIYQPGYGGHFLKYLFSLDASTSPQGNADPDNRLENYLFDNALKFKSWHEYHIVHSYDAVDRTYPVVVTCEHPQEFVYTIADHYIVDLSYEAFANYWLVATKQRWNYFPSLRVGEFKTEQQIRDTYNPKTINMDAFLDPALWEAEYLRVTTLMSIPPQLEQARILYQSWYNIRVLPLRTEFDQLADTSEYLAKRLEHQRYGNYTDPAWQEFYAGIRGADWPDCISQDHINQLPEDIQHELYNRFLKQ